MITGSKAWITNANHLDVCLLAARIKDGEPNSRFGLFLVDAHTPGVSKGKPFETMLRGCSNLGELFFQDVRAGEDRLLGGPAASGISQAARTLSVTRTLYAARCVAACELALHKAIAYLGERQGFEKSLFDLPLVKVKLATVKMQIKVARAFAGKCLVAAREGIATPWGCRKCLWKRLCGRYNVRCADE
ncbi:hypothetical protein GCM10010909_14130 [Acidocella aquatica]|uniref:Acyl-[acyl-carrier-protein] dehydrogenase MbtN n=1 Tax=Acidocella aquatica TaxID=1922313 RepID=A0ABQ6A603_9PROT|nr:hypothetical protein GCM10010909_14130 [Acidocella aquatica]